MSSDVLFDKRKLKKPPLDIHVLGDRVLRQTAKRITKVDDEIRAVARQMLQTMYCADGIGLAAPQVAIAKQLIVIDVDPEEASNPPMILVNPTIRRYSPDLSLGQEGCLSVPGVYLDVQRPELIEVAYKDEQGRPQRLIATDLLSRVIQHEMDHLAGVMFVDRVENPLLLNQALTKQGFSKRAVKPLSAV